MKLLSKPATKASTIQMSGAEPWSNLPMQRVDTSAVSPTYTKREFTVFQNSSVTVVDSHVLRLLTFASMPLVSKRNKIVDDPELLDDARAIADLAVIDYQLDPMPFS